MPSYFARVTSSKFSPTDSSSWRIFVLSMFIDDKYAIKDLCLQSVRLSYSLCGYSTYSSPACLAVSTGRMILNTVECYDQRRVLVSTYLSMLVGPLRLHRVIPRWLAGYPRDNGYWQVIASSKDLHLYRIDSGLQVIMIEGKSCFGWMYKIISDAGLGIKEYSSPSASK